MLGRLAAFLCVIPFIAAIAIHFAVAIASSEPAHPVVTGHSQRLSASDLEISGDLKGFSAGSVRYLTREDLLTLPQVSYNVTDDSNFAGSTEISGVLLEDLIRAVAAAPNDDLVTAICDDQYEAHYPRSYLSAHHPLLVLKVNGQPPEQWPKAADGNDQEMGPYLISHRLFTPAFKVLAHQDEAQIPWGVVRLDFRNEKQVLGSIAPQGANSHTAAVQDGYRIAQQNCFRCHNMGSAGGLKARHPWLVLSAWATASPEYFSAYVRNPQSQNRQAQMYPNPGYDDATMKALVAYFQTFTSPSSSSREKEKP